VIAAAPKWLPPACGYVRGFVVDPRRDGIGILVLESDDSSVAIGEVRHLAFSPELCELDALEKLISEEDATDAEGNVSKIVKTAEVALSWAESPVKVNAGNWSVAIRIDADPVRMEEALQAVLTAREAAKANAATAAKPAEIVASAPASTVTP